MWKDISFLTQDENISGEDLLQFQVSLNRKLSHALSYIRSSQVINIEANKITTNEAFITNAQIGSIEANKITVVNAQIQNAQIQSIEANKITVVNAKIQSAQIDTITANQINTGTLTGIEIFGVTITGGTFQTSANLAANRIVISSNSFQTYKGSSLNGLAFGALGNFNETIFYANGFEALKFFKTTNDDSFNILPTSGFDLNIGGFTTVYALGLWNFQGTVSGITAANNGDHAHSGSTNQQADHNHGFPNTDYLAVYDSGGTFVGYRQWTPSGGHFHTVGTNITGSHTHTIS